MKKGVRFAYKATVILAAIAFMVFTGNYACQMSRTTVCKNIEIEIPDRDSAGFITPEVITDLLRQAGLSPLQKPLKEVNTDTLEKFISQHPHVLHTQVFTTSTGTLHINILQRKAIARIIGSSVNRYIDQTGKLIPLSWGYSPRLPVITFETDTVYIENSGINNAEKSDIFLTENHLISDNLLNFVKFVYTDTLWKAQIVQINCTANQEIELIPRIGSHIILMGDLSDYRHKLRKLEAFYKNRLQSPDFDSYKTINLKYSNQVVCTK